MNNDTDLLIKEQREINRFFSVTQSIKYIGSKKDLLHKIIHLISEVSQQDKITHVLDGFSGSTRVSQALAINGYTVISNDIAPYSEVLANCYLKTTQPRDYYQNKINILNKVDGKRGILTKLYGGNGNSTISTGQDKKKKMFQYHNTEKADNILDIIETENSSDRNVLLTSLILALDKVDSSIGHQASYLREWAHRSYKPMILEVPRYNIYTCQHKVVKENIFDLVKKINVDLAYFDPPYSSNNEKMPASRVRYNCYYHIWTTICLNDNPEVFGACNRRTDSRDANISVFEEFKKDKDTGEYITTLKIKELIESASAKYILFSYSNNGRTDKNSFVRILNSININYKFFEFNYKKNVMYSLQSTQEYVNNKENIEYLILIDKTNRLILDKID